MVQTVMLAGRAGPMQVEDWRRRARQLLSDGQAPDAVQWRTGAVALHGDLFLQDEEDSAFSSSFHSAPPRREESATPTAAVPFAMTRATLALLQRIGCHAHPDRYHWLYEAVWRMQHGEGHLFELRADPLVQILHHMDVEVRREMHKTKAFVRFEAKTLEDGGQHYVAWFEPKHHALELVLPFFQKRFTHMRWSILTPQMCAEWDGQTLHLHPGLDTPPAGSSDDVLHEAWTVYYASTFNPTRLRVRAMLKEMPAYYWRNLPEAKLIPRLIQSAECRADGMLKAAPTLPDRPQRPWQAPERPALDHCMRCPHAMHATQAVPGIGPMPAQLMLVGEQPGDQEDLQGRPFLGPAGEVLDQAMAQAGISRAEVFMTNAVKHFMWRPRGKRRLHSKPGPAEVDACRDHLLDELNRVQPRVIVALGETARQALLGGTGLQAERGVPLPLPGGRWLVWTYHPAFVLRADVDTSQAALSALISHLQIAQTLAAPSEHVSLVSE